jgi:AcrR family transcriptional regulator
MQVRRRHFKQRDAEETKRQILEAASQIVIEDGFSALTATRIALLIGKDRTIVNHHFGSLANLKRAYIRQKDYWPPFFERFRLPSSPGALQIRGLFTELMQENFRYFRNNLEMQKIILWQISEQNPLMRRISEERELEGAKLLGMTEPFFKNSGVNFKAVEALLLGGIYYVVMHAENNKSTVCGIDINQYRDRAIFQETIGQVIDLAWEKAFENKDAINKATMNIEFDILEAMVKDLAEKHPSGSQARPPESALVKEAKRIETLVSTKLLALKNPTQVSTLLNMVLQKLIRICDGLFDIYGMVSPETEVILELLTAIKSIVPQNISPQLPLPKAFVLVQSEYFQVKLNELQASLKKQEIDALLIEIASLPVQAFSLEKGKLVWGDYTWLRRFFNFLENIDWEHHDCGSTEEAFISALIRLGYNHQRFLGYCYWVIKEKTDAKTGRKAKL